MENASKALLIAGGVLITMLVVSLIVFAKNMVSDYYSSQQDLADIEDTTKFNLQFTNYDRDNVTGNDLLSLINKVVDYNARESDKATNNSQASPITIKINLGSKVLRQTKFTYNDELRLFTGDEYIVKPDESDSNTYIKNNFKEKVLDDLKFDIAAVGSEDDIKKIAKDIKGIFDLEVSSTESVKGVTLEQKKQAAVNLYNSYISNGVNRVDTYEKLTNEKKDAVYHYYEYVQFKKGYFNCTNLDYNDSTGRVNLMEFNFTGKIQ